MSSIAAGFGCADSAYSPLSGSDPLASPRRGHVVLIVVDGLGYNYLTQAKGVSALRQALHGKLTSVFPSTTATGVTSFLTGLAAQQHGLTGWHMHLDEIHESVAILPFETRAEGTPLQHLGVAPEQVFDYASFFQRINAQCHALSPDSIAHSLFNRHHTRGAQIQAYRSLSQFFESIERITRAQDRPQYLYAYLPDYDATAHEHGVHSLPTLQALQRFAQGFERLVRALAGRDVTLLVTADHGFVDVPAHQRLELAHHPHLQACLSQPLCGERRLPYCYVKDHMRAQFEDYVATDLGSVCRALPSAQLIAQGYFGLGKAHPRLARRVGDYTLLMNHGYTLKDWLNSEKRHTLIGVHGGLSDDEMYVPLIYVLP